MNGAAAMNQHPKADVETPRGVRLEKSKEKDAEFEEDAQSVIWGDMTGGQKVRQMLWMFLRLTLLLAFLYLFICSLGILEASFQLIGGKTAGETFQNNELLTNPVAGLMIGVLATVLVQSSSTSTSIIITMVGSNILEIRSAIPIIMGANIGTSVTNTLVSLAQASDRNEFRRAFAGATVHDMFNWLSVLVLLPLEAACHYLEWLTGLIVDSIHFKQHGKSPDMLKAITKPLIEWIVQVNKDVIKDTASLKKNETTRDIGDVLKRWCDVKEVVKNVSHTNHVGDVFVNCIRALHDSSSPVFALCQQVEGHANLDLSNTSVQMSFDSLDRINVTEHNGRCDNLFAQSDLTDTEAGAILLVLSLVVIFLALYGIVKILHSLLHGSLAKVIRKVVNSDLPGKAAYFTGYIAILVGTGMTMILQSSSVFTSTLTPLVGVGVVTVERMYPLTLGANIGTTLTGILAALSQEGDHVKDSLHVALCHLFFNVTGILLFYPVPLLRFPVDMAKSLGKTTAKHRWFAILYLIIFFIVLPGTVFALSLAGWIYLVAVAGPLLLIFLALLVVNALQRKKPGCLPRELRSWEFLPLWMHSLKPVDSLVSRVCRCGFCQRLQEVDLVETGDYEEERMKGEGGCEEEKRVTRHRNHATLAEKIIVGEEDRQNDDSVAVVVEPKTLATSKGSEASDGTPHHTGNANGHLNETFTLEEARL